MDFTYAVQRITEEASRAMPSSAVCIASSLPATHQHCRNLQVLASVTKYHGDGHIGA